MSHGDARSRAAFEESWARAWRDIGAQGDGANVRDALLARYAEPHRAYHTLQHLEECLALFDEARSLAEHPAEVELALWFHDAVYDPRSARNEQDSADWAVRALRDAGVAEDAAGRVHALVMATRHQAEPQSRDGQVLVDIDLSILGAPPARFAEYEAQIRREYAHVPGFLFRMKRRSILRGFLARPSIYATPELRARFEAGARENLAVAAG